MSIEQSDSTLKKGGTISNWLVSPFFVLPLIEPCLSIIALVAFGRRASSIKYDAAVFFALIERGGCEMELPREGKMENSCWPRRNRVTDNAPNQSSAS
jgi:hypothetical protein